MYFAASEHRAWVVHARRAGELRGGARGAAAGRGRAPRALSRLRITARHRRHAATPTQGLSWLVTYLIKQFLVSQLPIE